jgi:hypothetical protein
MYVPAPLARGVFDPSAVQDTSSPPYSESIQPLPATPSIEDTAPAGEELGPEGDVYQPISVPVNVAPLRIDFRTVEDGPEL